MAVPLLEERAGRKCQRRRWCYNDPVDYCYIGPGNMVTCREEALRWVHRYAAGGAALAAIPIPFAASPVLAALETHMLGVIGEIYNDVPSAPVTAAAGGTFAALGGGLKMAAGEATKLIPVVGPLIRSVIAASAIEAIGQAVVAHYERKYPGKVFSKKD